MPTKNRLTRGALLYWAVLFTLSAAIFHSIGALDQPPRSPLLVALLVGGAAVQAIVALAVVAVPSRRLLLAATAIEGAATLVWVIAHTAGLPDGLTIWHPETLGLPDLYLPALEVLSAFFFLCLFGRTWSKAPRPWRITMAALPSLVLIGVLIWGAVAHFAVAQIVLVVFILDGGLPGSLLTLFMPAVALLVVLLVLRLAWPRFRALTPGAPRAVLVLLPALLIVNILTWTGSVDAATTAWFPASPPASAPAGQTTTLDYCSSDGSPLAMDVTEPPAQAARPAPVVFYIHGGEALQGSRLLDDGSLDGAYFSRLRAELVRRGFVVGSIDYGLAPLHSVGSEVVDAKCAVRFLRAHAAELGIDPGRIGVYGPSQGGYLSAMVGLVGPQMGLDQGQYLNQSSQVEAVVDMWGPTDLTNWSGSPSWISGLNAGLTGGTSSIARERAASPVTYVAAGAPPFLIIHGTDDWFIAPHHSQDLAKRLHAAGVPATLVMVQHDGHGLAAPIADQTEQPGPDAIVQMIADFFTRTLEA